MYVSLYIVCVCVYFSMCQCCIVRFLTLRGKVHQTSASSIGPASHPPW